ncbi:unnamed protein product [Discosporangium mesarthrocarpum]
MDDVEELESHLDDLLEDEETEARIYNTIEAMKLLVPPLHKASQEQYAEYLGKL